jgi:glutamate/tyrosine decarboxylase-like PLP-dependent enzyme
MLPGQPLSFTSSLEVTLCDGRRKAFRHCTTWELLNLTPNEVLDLPGRLSSQFGIPIPRLENILAQYSIQSVGKAKLDLAFNITEPPQYLIGPTNHYSWAKGTAITGIGRDNLIELKLDLDARLDTQDLRRHLDEHLERQQAVYAVVVIAGSTEHGAVDPISEVVEIRKEYQALGLSFMIHADAAWGGYFATKVTRDCRPIDRSQAEYAFSLELSGHTNKQLFNLRYVDSVTLDPHKSGYIPYPGGGICYRDGRLRFLVRWTTPVLNTAGDEPGCVGIYGIEGRFVKYLLFLRALQSLIMRQL